MWGAFLPHHKRRQVARRLRPAKQTEKKQRFTIETNPLQSNGLPDDTRACLAPVSACLDLSHETVSPLSRATVSLIPPANNNE